MTYDDQYTGLKQRRWVHLLRDIHDLKGLDAEDAKLARRAAAAHQPTLRKSENLRPPRGGAEASCPTGVGAEIDGPV